MNRLASLDQRPRRSVRGRGALGALLALAAAGTACGDPPAPADPPVFDVTIDCTAATAWTFPDTALGQTASVLLLATRSDDGDGAPAQLVLDGPDAAMFRVVADASTCAGRSLAPGETCVALVEYTPTAEGPHAASLHLGKTALELGGAATAMPQGLTASIRNATSMHGFYSVASSHTVQLVNQTATDIALGTGTFTGTDAAFGATVGCPATLAPGTACEIQLTATPQTGGCVAGTYRLPSSLNTIEIPISISSASGVELLLRGRGAGRVVSSPPGLDCHHDPASGEQTGRCEQVFAAPVTLTAIPDPGHHFNGWLSGYVHGDTYTVKPMSTLPRGLRSISVNAEFASADAKQIAVTFAGSGKGLVRGSLNCAASCTGWIEPGQPGQLYAGTPSQLGGWSGACSGTARACDLGLVTDDRATTVTFDAEDHEQAMLLGLPTSIARGGFLPDGELVVADAGGDSGVIISRLSLAGDVRWSTRVAAARPVSLKAAPSGEIYMYGTNTVGSAGTLSKLDAAGAIAWQRDTPAPGGYEERTRLALVPGGGATILATGAVRSYATDGTLAWSAAFPAVAIAIDPTGMTAVASSSGLVRRFSATGAPLAPDWMLPPTSAGSRVALAYDPQGFLVAQTLWDPSPGMGQPLYTLSRLDPMGATIFAKPIVDATPQPAFPPWRTGGIAVTPSGAVLSWIRHSYAGRLGGAHVAGALLEVYDPQGARTWVVDKLPYGSAERLEDGVLVEDIACRNGSCAVFGSYVLRGGGTSWIEIFTAP